MMNGKRLDPCWKFSAIYVTGSTLKYRIVIYKMVAPSRGGKIKYFLLRLLEILDIFRTELNFYKLSQQDCVQDIYAYLHILGRGEAKMQFQYDRD